MQMVIIISMFSVLAGVLSFGKLFKHLLRMLISLEFLVLIIFFVLVGQVYQLITIYFITLIYLIFSVCEGALGLTILVVISRRFGGDYLSRFIINI